MCLIATFPPAQILSDSELRTIYSDNSDGVGGMWATQAGDLKVCRRLPQHATDAVAAVKRMCDLAMADGSDLISVHWRYATHGGVNRDNVHPFRVNRKIAVAHNGVLLGYGDTLRSDTREYVEDVIVPMVREKGAVDLATISADTRGSRLAIAKAEIGGRLTVERTGSWSQVAGVWYSNLNHHTWAPTAKATETEPILSEAIWAHDYLVAQGEYDWADVYDAALETSDPTKVYEILCLALTGAKGLRNVGS